ncbi:MAG: hypothetical protein ABI759_12280 [Candidatus Solibacter sp.]
MHRDPRQYCSPARNPGADVDHYAAARSIDRQAGPEPGGQALVHEDDISRPGIAERFDRLAPFYLRHTAGYGNDNLQPVQRSGNVRFPKEPLQHATEKPVIVDDPGGNWPRGLKFSRCPPAAGFRISADRLDGARAGSYRDGRRLINGDSATLDI